MDKTDSLLEEKFMIGHFEFPTPLRFKVKVKEIIQKHNKEIRWKFSERNSRDTNGDRIIVFELYTDKESFDELNDKIILFVGLIEDIYHSVGEGMDEETANNYNLVYLGIASGEEIEKIGDFSIININKKIVYYYIKAYNGSLYIFGDINKIIEIEKKYPEIIKKVYNETVQEWYERNVKCLKKMFIDKEQLEVSKLIVEKLEKNTNIKKIPYKLNKFRFTTLYPSKNENYTF